MFAAAESIPFYLHALAPTPGGHTAQGGPLVAGRVCWGSGVQPSSQAGGGGCAAGLGYLGGHAQLVAEKTLPETQKQESPEERRS